MTLFGKILTVIILILSLVFGVVAVIVGSNYKNYRQEALSLKTDLTKEQNLRDTQNSTIQNLEQDLAREQFARARALAELQSRLLNLQSQVEEKEKQLAAEKDKATQTLEQMQESLARTKELDDRIKVLIKENQDYAQAISTKVTALNALQQQNYQIQGELERKQERTEQLVNQLAVATRIMTKLGVDKDFETASIEPVVETKLTEAGADLVAFHLGIDDDLRVGHQFEVYRGTRFMGIIEVTKLEGGNRAIAKVLSQEAKMRVGDIVKTKVKKSDVALK
jgi:hypothetical protein